MNASDMLNLDFPQTHTHENNETWTQLSAFGQI